MQETNLHKRLALLVLSIVGNKTRNIVIGTIIFSIVLAFFVPSATARAGAVVPILLGMIAAFKVSKDSKLLSVFINNYLSTSCVNLEYWYQNGGSTKYRSD